MRSRQKIMDATLRVIERGGFPAVNVAAVATEAGVSRQTVYSIFGSRQEMVSQALSAVVLDVFDDIRCRLEASADTEEAVVEFIVAGRAQMRTHPVLITLLTGRQDNPILGGDVMAEAVPVITELFSVVFARQMREGAVLDDVIEMITRAGLSVVMFDSRAIASDDDLRAFLRRWLLPALGPLLVSSERRGDPPAGS